MTPIFAEFPDSQVEGATIWLNVNRVVVVLPGPQKTTSTLMLSNQLDAGIEVTLPVEQVLSVINDAIQQTKQGKYYLHLDKQLYNAEAT